MTAPQLSLQLRTFSDDAPADGWRSLVDAARAADAAGIDRIVVSDHVVMGENLDAYGDPARGGTRGGRQPTGPDGHWLDPLAVLAHLAAVTERVRLGTNILIAALRRPVVLAGQASTIDVLSRGRLDLGVGVGWQAEEYEAAGLDYSGRGRLPAVDEGRAVEIAHGSVEGAEEMFRIEPAPRSSMPGSTAWASSHGERTFTR